ncbi:MAG: hypothetical protein HY805_06355 [Nitrospirae bacterium]|nr:hypothetical protein [Nitrospirota bacterium]
MAKKGSTFKIGRSVDLSQRKSAHGCDEIIPLYETSSSENAIEVEDGLIKHFINHQKRSNDSPHGGGGTSDGYINYTYIALWFNPAFL